VPRLGLEP